MQASALKNMPVVSVADGVQVGRVADVLFETATLRVAALLLSARDGQSVLPFEAIRSIGADAVTIESVAATQGGGGPAEGVRGLGELMSLSVVNGDGALLGAVKDLKIDPADGRLLELQVHRGGILGFGGTHQSIPASAIRGIGPKLVTADLPAPSGEEAVS